MGEAIEKPVLRLALAVDPTTKGFAFVLLEDGLLIDWGVRHAGSNKNVGSIRKLRVLLTQYKPDVLIIEDVNHRSSRRWRRVRQLVGWFAREARRNRILLRRVAHQQVRKQFATYSPQVTKYRVAVALAQRFPELQERLPRVRKMWMTEDERMSIFDALAMAIVATNPVVPTSLDHLDVG
jgi:hypothetical protein